MNSKERYVFDTNTAISAFLFNQSNPALQLFKDHKLSFGKAAELAGISRDDFLIELDKNKIDFIAYDPSELEAELERF